MVTFRGVDAARSKQPPAIRGQVGGAAEGVRTLRGMRVGLVLEQCLAPVPGGTGRYARDLASSLGRTAPAGATVSSWVGWHRDVAAARVAGVSGPRRLPLPGRALPYAWERGRGPAPTRVDVVHAPTLLVPPRRDYRMVVTIHDAVPWTHPQLLTRRGVAFHRRMADRAARDADLVVVPSAAVRSELAAVLPGIGRVEVVPPGYTGSLQVPADVAARAARIGLPAGDFVLTVATLEPRKGLDILVAAMASKGGPTLPLVVVGQAGWGGVHPDEIAAAAGLPPRRLRLLGRVSDADLAVCYARATVSVTPSLAEGFGLPVLEAMAAGTPVVTSAVPALVELGADAVVTVPVADPVALASELSALLADPARQRALAAAGRARAAEFDGDRSANRLWELYLDL